MILILNLQIKYKIILTCNKRCGLHYLEKKDLYSDNLSSTGHT